MPRFENSRLRTCKRTAFVDYCGGLCDVLPAPRAFARTRDSYYSPLRASASSLDKKSASHVPRAIACQLQRTGAQTITRTFDSTSCAWQTVLCAAAVPPPLPMAPVRSARPTAPLLLLCLGASLCEGHSQYRSNIPNGGLVDQQRYGHSSGSGSGLNSFGNDLNGAGISWTLGLCTRDSDGDGQTNGLELGDPCFTWSMGGGSPSGGFFISSPGDRSETTVRGRIDREG